MKKELIKKLERNIKIEMLKELLNHCKEMEKSVKDSSFKEVYKHTSLVLKSILLVNFNIDLFER